MKKLKIKKKYQKIKFKIIQVYYIYIIERFERIERDLQLKYKSV